MVSKKRDGFSLFIVVLLLFLVSVYLTLMFQPLFNITVSSKEMEDNIKQTIIDRTGLERVYAKLEDNISFKGTLIYEDLEKDYTVSTVMQKMRKVQLHNRNSFNIHNATDIEMSFKYYRIEETEDSKYTIRIFYNDDIIKEYLYLTESTVLKIHTDFLYDKNSHETNYGKYSIELITDNCMVDTMVTYNELDYREILIEGDTIKAILVAENDISIGGLKQLYIKEGD